MGVSRFRWTSTSTSRPSRPRSSASRTASIIGAKRSWKFTAAVRRFCRHSSRIDVASSSVRPIGFWINTVALTGRAARTAGDAPRVASRSRTPRLAPQPPPRPIGKHGGCPTAVRRPRRERCLDRKSRRRESRLRDKPEGGHRARCCRHRTAPPNGNAPASTTTAGAGMDRKSRRRVSCAPLHAIASSFVCAASSRSTLGALVERAADIISSTTCAMADRRGCSGICRAWRCSSASLCA